MSSTSRRAFVPFVLSIVAFASACRSTSAPEQRAARDDRYVFAFLVTGPSTETRTKEAHGELMNGHMANIQRLADEKKLDVAGPFGNERPDAALRGVFVLATPSIDEARGWVATDPVVKAGVMAPELATFECSTPLARVLDLEAEAKAAAKREGRELRMQDTIRPYVMVLAQDPARAKKALEPLANDGKVLFAGELRGSPRAKYLAILDAEKLADADLLLASVHAEVGPHALASWWATRSLVKLAPNAGAR